MFIFKIGEKKVKKEGDNHDDQLFTEMRRCLSAKNWFCVTVANGCSILCYDYVRGAEFLGPL
jgi:hypothetical protein